MERRVRGGAGEEDGPMEQAQYQVLAMGQEEMGGSSLRARPGSDKGGYTHECGDGCVRAELGQQCCCPQTGQLASVQFGEEQDNVKPYTQN